jgi:hypothetical protein
VKTTVLAQRSTAHHSSDTRWKIVLARLMLGYEVDITTEGRIWPKAFGNAMPEYILEYPRKTRTRVRHDAREQTLADESRPWIARYVPNEGRRQLMQAYIACTFHGWRKETFAERVGEEKSEMMRDVEAGCRQIVEGLDSDGKAVLL